MRKTERLAFRCTKDEKTELKRVSEKLGLPKSYLLSKCLQSLITKF